MKRKIGILTFHASNNYGAVLQAYALRKTLSGLSKDNEVHIIDYRCEGTITPTAFKDIKKKKGTAGALLHYRQISAMNKKFNLFRKKYLNMTDSYYDLESLGIAVNEYDAIISGSDQVWNLRWSDGDPVYFQTFHNQNDKKYSYAASFGFTELEDSKEKFYREALESFRGISVREKTGADIVRGRLGLECVQSLDPTLLLTADMWSDIASDPAINRKYILVYMVPKQESIINYALELGKKTGLPIVMLSKNLKPLNVHHYGSSSPQEFVGWFKNAEYVITNSFHGTAFSCIFGRNIWIDLNTERGFNTRSKSLIELCGLADNISEGGTAFISEEDWLGADAKLNAERKASVRYLQDV